jgi:8-oxo-dGTP pyrophosphatase MutT (NUDIX family)
LSLLRELQTYNLTHPHERESIDLFTAFLKKDSSLTPPQMAGHLTASAWIMNFDRTKVLLTHHAKLHKWFQLGGHIDQGESILEAALREAEEESGLSSLQSLDRGIFDIDAHLIPAGKSNSDHFHFDIRFLFQADSEETLQLSSESKELRWVTPEEAGELNNSESMIRMIEKTKKLPAYVFGVREPMDSP